ncbi:MAG: glycosyl hydrolase-related protein [Candidatus Sumerlaeota bacterium]|nr:glycosyl hydrolase-related protein [Candidatus Sumerlaeota bacterium]
MNLANQMQIKLNRIENSYRALRYETVARLDAKYWDTKEHLRSEPKNVAWRPMARGARWGGDWLTRWFVCDFAATPPCAGKRLFVKAKTGGLETLVFVNGEPKGVFDGRAINTPTTNHTVVCIDLKAVRGRKYHLALESYCGHTRRAGHIDNSEKGLNITKDSNLYEHIDVVLAREDVCAFYYDFLVLRRLMQALDPASLRHRDIHDGLDDVIALVDPLPEETEEASWRPKMRQAHAVLKALLAKRNGPSTPRAGLIGHTHIDTAWNWTLDETIRKAARSYSSVLNLMDQYPEFMFLQSSPYHVEILRQEYPRVFEGIVKHVKEGRWEPNGAMWVESDGNIPSGEAFVRQLCVGQRYTREVFGYTSDTLWLPDTFGFSGALPQILRKTGVRFFCTQKMSWGETRFPYTSFRWRGIDGTAVVTHFNTIGGNAAEPKALLDRWGKAAGAGGEDAALCAFGYGDGGGGPHLEAVEVARQLKDVEGCPRAEFTTVSNFMKRLERKKDRLPVWSGELYLSTHRGTLASRARLKRLNRRAELALRDAELAAVIAKLNGRAYPAADFDRLWKALALNQFHNIVTGTSIVEVHDRAEKELADVAGDADQVFRSSWTKLTKPSPAVTFVNTLSWERQNAFAVDASNGAPELPSAMVQTYTDVAGVKKMAIAGLRIPALGAVSAPVKAVRAGQPSTPFSVRGRTIETPHLRLGFHASGRITLCVDKASGRELVRPGGALNRFLTGEDIPATWDSCDIDRDQARKMRDDGRLLGGAGAAFFLSRDVVSNGPVQLRIRSAYAIGKQSKVTQDMVMWADSPRIDFETKIEWKEIHTLFHAAFDLDVLSETARYEIQFGHLERPRHANRDEDKAQFECPVHKWLDVSETNFGVALLNEGKYAAHADLDSLNLTLIKSSAYPDPRGDEGEHWATYSLLPHASGFSAQSVIHPAYELNSPVRVVKGEFAGAPFLSCDRPNVIVESVKWAEAANAFVLRVYEAEKTGSFAQIGFGRPVKSVVETDLLEEKPRPVRLRDSRIRFYIRPFEIKTFVCHV